MKVLGLIRDLFFRSKINAVARASGAEVNYASTLQSAIEQCGGESMPLVFVDLSDSTFQATETVSRLRAAAPKARLIGFASHVDLKSLRSARDAGFDLTLSREEFTSRLAEFLSPAPNR